MLLSLILRSVIFSQIVSSTNFAKCRKFTTSVSEFFVNRHEICKKEESHLIYDEVKYEIIKKGTCSHCQRLKSFV